MSITGVYSDRLNALIDHYDASGTSDTEGCNGDDRYALVERNTRDSGEYWITTFPVIQDAAEYHDGQEYPEDWIIEVLIDLATDERYDAEPQTRFRKVVTS